jgi:hypothetical protein
MVVLFSAQSKDSSQFWKCLQKVKHLCKWGALFSLRNGLNCRFWQDCCILNVPLKIAYGDLFKLVREPDITVADCWVDNDWFFFILKDHYLC